MLFNVNEVLFEFVYMRVTFLFFDCDIESN